MRALRRGFTLIELLIVCAIIAVLAAILFPVLARAQEKARQATCLSNVRQIGMAMLMYSGDYDSRLPLIRGAAPVPLFATSWMDALEAYVGNLQVFICPSSDDHSVNWRVRNDLLLNYGYPPASGSFILGAPPNHRLISFHGIAQYDGLGGWGDGTLGMYRWAWPSKRTTDLARPAELVLVSDHTFFDWGLCWGGFYYPATRHFASGSYGGGPFGQVCCAFADGHAKSINHAQYWEIRRIDSARCGTIDVYWHFWPYD